MNLFEEYCRRHGLRCPVIKRPDARCQIAFRANPVVWRANWVVFQVCLKQEQYAPSYFHFGWLAPVHNGAFRTSCFDFINGDGNRVEWDNYDVEIIKVAQRNDGLEPIAELAEAKMATWEMFLYSADERIGQLPMSMRHTICVSLDPTLSLKDRMQAQDEVCRYFYETGSAFGPRWEQLKQYYEPGNYASWFADLMKQMRDKNYRQDFSNLPDVA